MTCSQMWMHLYSYQSGSHLFLIRRGWPRIKGNRKILLEIVMLVEIAILPTLFPK